MVGITVIDPHILERFLVIFRTYSFIYCVYNKIKCIWYKKNIIICAYKYYNKISLFMYSYLYIYIRCYIYE